METLRRVPRRRYPAPFHLLPYGRIKSPATIVAAGNFGSDISSPATGAVRHGAARPRSVCLPLARNAAPLNYPSYLPADILEETVLRGAKRIISIMSRRAYTCAVAH